MSRKTLLSLIVAIAVIATLAFSVAAQDETDSGDTTFPFGWMHGQFDGEFTPGMMGRGFGPGMMMGQGFGPGMMWTDGENGMQAMADALGLELDALYTALQDGQSLTEIAETQGVEMDVLYGAMIAHAAEHMATLVEAGTITSEEAGEHLAWMNENIESMPMFSDSGVGPCMNGGMFANQGFRGRGHGHGRWNNNG